MLLSAATTLCVYDTHGRIFLDMPAIIYKKQRKYMMEIYKFVHTDPRSDIRSVLPPVKYNVAILITIRLHNAFLYHAKCLGWTSGKV